MASLSCGDAGHARPQYEDVGSDFVLLQLSWSTINAGINGAPSISPSSPSLGPSSPSLSPSVPSLPVQVLQS